MAGDTAARTAKPFLQCPWDSGGHYTERNHRHSGLRHHRKDPFHLLCHYVPLISSTGACTQQAMDKDLLCKQTKQKIQSNPCKERDGDMFIRLLGPGTSNRKGQNNSGYNKTNSSFSLPLMKFRGGEVWEW